MTGAPAERAAALSARIHGELNAGRPVPIFGVIGRDEPPQDYAALLHGFSGMAGDFKSPFWQLGAELRAIVLGNREGRR